MSDAIQLNEKINDNEIRIAKLESLTNGEETHGHSFLIKGLFEKLSSRMHIKACEKIRKASDKEIKELRSEAVKLKEALIEISTTVTRIDNKIVERKKQRSKIQRRIVAAAKFIGAGSFVGVMTNIKTVIEFIKGVF